MEFLVASGAALIMLLGTFTFLGNVFSSTATMRDLMDTQQKIRVALNEIAREVLRAGTGLSSTGIGIANGANAVALVRGGPGMNLGNLNTGAPPPATQGVLAMLTPGDGVGPMIGGIATDAITILTVDQSAPRWNISAIANPANPRVDWVENIGPGAFESQAHS